MEGIVRSLGPRPADLNGSFAEPSAIAAALDVHHHRPAPGPGQPLRLLRDIIREIIQRTTLVRRNGFFTAAELHFSVRLQLLSQTVLMRRPGRRRLVRSGGAGARSRFGAIGNEMRTIEQAEVDQAAARAEN